MAELLTAENGVTELNPDEVLTDDNISKDMAKEYEDGKGGED